MLTITHHFLVSNTYGNNVDIGIKLLYKIIFNHCTDLSIYTEHMMDLQQPSYRVFLFLDSGLTCYSLTLRATIRRWVATETCQVSQCLERDSTHLPSTQLPASFSFLCATLVFSVWNRYSQ